jgi:hypothetical protein
VGLPGVRVSSTDIVVMKRTVNTLGVAWAAAEEQKKLEGLSVEVKLLTCC